jgi:predicted nucleotidyltransferase
VRAAACTGYEARSVVSRSQTIAFLERREGERQKALDERFQAAWAGFRSVASMIEAEFKPARIWQWGSLLDRPRFSEISDIDIGVEGLGGADRFFRLVEKAEALTNLPLDIVELERLEPEFAHLVRTRGRIVHGDG